MAAYIIVGIVAYLIGSISFSVLISKKMAGFDVREKGSGNAGATNMLRSVGKKAAALTLLGDALKGVVAIIAAIIIGKIAKETNIELLKYIAGILVVVGHTFPIYFGFKGGKGVATSLGVILMLNWRCGLLCLLFALLLMALTRMVSVGSVAAAVLFPLAILFLDGFNITKLVCSALLAAFVIYNHRTNIQRILNGTENRLSFKKKD